MKKLLAVILSVLLIVAAFAGCSSAKDESEKTTAPASDKKVAILQFMPHASLDNCTKGIKNILDKEGVAYDIQTGSSASAVADCQSYAEQMASGGYDAIIAVATPAAVSAYSAVQNAGLDIPVIFCAVSDPVAAKLVESNEAPGNNCTGTQDALDIAGNVALIKSVQPDIKKLGVFYTVTEPNSISQLAELKKECDANGIELLSEGINDASELPAVSAKLVPQVDAIINFTDNNVVDNMQVYINMANEKGVPVYGSEIEQVKKGCLASASLDYVALGEKTGNMALEILGGKKASEYPVVTVKDSFLCYNPDVASNLKIKIPDSLKDAQQVETEEAE